MRENKGFDIGMPFFFFPDLGCKPGAQEDSVRGFPTKLLGIKRKKKRNRKCDISKQLAHLLAESDLVRADSKQPDNW